jgi:hypothetical protein
MHLMSRRRVLRTGRSSPDALDLVSLGRRGPSRAFTPSQIERIRLTVHRAPEVVVKVSGGGRNAGGVKAHFAYLARHGKLDIETDDERVLSGHGAPRELVEDWNLDSRAASGTQRQGAGRGPKQVHNIVLSMPRRTDPEKLLSAARTFAKNEFEGRNRYALVLHTDQEHPHVHLVVKAVGLNGERLRIQRETLRAWREQFAEQLRARGIAANATHRAVRGENRSAKKDGIHRSIARGESAHLDAKLQQVVTEIRRGELTPGPGKAALSETRRTVVQGWLTAADQLRRQGESGLAQDVERFAQHMPSVRTEKEMLAAHVLTHLRAANQGRGGRASEPPVRVR